MANAYGLPDGPLAAYLSVRDQNGRASLVDTQNSVGQVGILQHIQAAQQAQQVRGIMANAKSPEDAIPALMQAGPVGLQTAGVIAQLQQHMTALGQAKREAAFRDPANLQQFMTPGSPASAAPPDDLGGGPPKPAMPGQIDPQRLLSGAVAAGVVNPLQYAQEQISNNKPTYAPRNSPGYWQGGIFNPTPQPAAANTKNVQMFTDAQGNPWERDPTSGTWHRGVVAPGEPTGAPGAEPAPTPPTTPPGAMAPPGGWQVPPGVQAQRDAAAATIVSREGQPNGGGAIPTASVVGGPPVQTPPSSQFLPPKAVPGSAPPMAVADMQSAGAQVAMGMPLTQVVPGFGRDAVNQRNAARAEAIKQIKAERPGMTEIQAGQELAQRNIDFIAGKSSSMQLNKMLGATKQAVNQLEFNIDKTVETLKSLPSSDLSPIINAIARGEEKWTGDPKYSALFYYMTATATESARILSGGQASAAQLHQGAAEEAKNWANVNMTPKSFIEGVAPAMKQEGRARLRTYEQAMQSQRVGANRPGANQPAAGTPGDYSHLWN